MKNRFCIATLTIVVATSFASISYAGWGGSWSGGNWGRSWGGGNWGRSSGSSKAYGSSSHPQSPIRQSAPTYPASNQALPHYPAHAYSAPTHVTPHYAAAPHAGQSHASPSYPAPIKDTYPPSGSSHSVYPKTDDLMLAAKSVNREIKLSCPDDAVGQCEYTLISTNGTPFDYTISAGKKQAVQASGMWRIKFARSGGDDWVGYNLTPGHRYVLQRDADGLWDLYLR